MSSVFPPGSRPAPSPQPFTAKRPMSRDKADMLMLLTACALVLAPHAMHLPGWASAAAAFLLFWRGWITFRGERMPPRWLLLPIAAGAMTAVYFTHKTFIGRDAGVTMLVLLLAFKLLEMNARRDLFVVIFLAFFLMLTALFYSQSIGTALLLSAALIAMLTAQLSYQYTNSAPPFRTRLWLGTRIFLLAVPLTLVLFYLFPRVQGPLWGMPGEGGSARTGMSETMAPGNISRVALSDDVAFRAKFVDAPPDKPQRYWRASVLGNYDGRTWSPLRLPYHRVEPTILQRNGNPIRYQVTMEPTSQHWLFALEAPAAAPALRDNAALISSDMQLRSAKPITERLRYDVSSHTDFRLQPQATRIGLQDWLELPPGFNPLTHQFAGQLRSHTDDPAAMIDMVLAYFREQNFRYTLEAPLLGRNAVDDFLFGTRAGFCEHYSSAFVVLMRVLDIPARVVTGYQGGAMNPVDGFMTVRQSDAHAWAEVWLAGRGWVRVDPTAAVAPDRIERNLESVLPRRAFGGLLSFESGPGSLLSQLKGIQQHWDAVTNGWNQWVMNYTPNKQKSFLRSLGFDNADWRTMAILLLVCGGVALGAVTLPLLLHRQKRDPLDVLYRTLCLRMAQRGLPRALHEGPRAYRRRLIDAESPLAPQTKSAASQFLKLIESARYAETGTASSANIPGAAGKHSRAALISTLKSLLSQCR